MVDIVSLRFPPVLWGFVGAVAEQAPFTSEFVGSILTTDSCEKSQLLKESIPHKLAIVVVNYESR